MHPSVPILIVILVSIFLAKFKQEEILQHTVKDGQIVWTAPDFARMQAALTVCRQQSKASSKLASLCAQRIAELRIVTQAYISCRPEQEKPACQTVVRLVEEQKDDFLHSFKLAAIDAVDLVDLEVWTPKNSFVATHWRWPDRQPWVRRRAMVAAPYVGAALVLGVISGTIVIVTRRRRTQEAQRVRDEKERLRREQAVREANDRLHAKEQERKRVAAEAAALAAQEARRAAAEQERQRQLEALRRDQQERKARRDLELQDEAQRALMASLIKR
jgi:hypothetical protein